MTENDVDGWICLLLWLSLAILGFAAMMAVTYVIAEGTAKENKEDKNEKDNNHLR